MTASVERIPIKVALLNNAYLGMVRQWQELFYDERYSEVHLSHDMPDYVRSGPSRWAASPSGSRSRTRSVSTIAKANQINDRPVVVEFRCLSSEKVYPMVPAGGSNDDVHRRPEPACREPGVPPGRSGRRGVMSNRPRSELVTPEVLPHRTIVVLVENKAGVLARVADLFARRGYNIMSLAVAPTNDDRFSRLTIVVDIESTPLDQIVKQLFKLVNVVEIAELGPGRFGRARAAAGHGRGRRPRTGARSIEITDIFEGKILAVSPGHLTVSLDGRPGQARRLRGPAGGLPASSICNVPGRIALPKVGRQVPRLRAL